MKGVLVVACGWAILGLANANKMCIGTNCARDCDGDQCGENCKGEACAQNCEGQSCGFRCIGKSCAQNCTGNYCGAACVGQNCAAGCTDNDGTVDTCSNECFHFEGETCTDEPNTPTITMGANCSTDSPYKFECEIKNHPALWQALKETDEEGITLPTGDIKQCYYNDTESACVDTPDNFPPLVCNHFADCWDPLGTFKIHNFSKCTDIQQCGLCMGICEKDSQCKGGLKCFVRTGGETVPGCSSSSIAELNVPGVGYCADIPDSSGLKGGDIAAIAIGTLVLSAAVGALVWWCKKTKRGFFGSSGGMAEPIKL